MISTTSIKIKLAQKVKIRPYKKYEAVSLIEMIITVLIIGFVLTVVAVTLTAMIKASAISEAKTLSRNESEFILEVLKRHVENSEADEILVYSTTGRSIDPVTGDINSEESGEVEIVDVEANGTDSGNEVHFRPIGSDDWVCVAMYPGDASLGYEDIGFILKTTADSLSSGEDCFDSSANPDMLENLIFLNVEEVDINSLDIKYFINRSGNYSFVIDLNLEPVHWVPGTQSQFKPEYIRQLVVSTGKLTL